VLQAEKLGANPFPHLGEGDCFASLAMTGSGVSLRGAERRSNLQQTQSATEFTRWRIKPMRFLTSNIGRAGRDADPHHLLWWRRASVPAIFTYMKADWY